MKTILASLFALALFGCASATVPTETVLKVASSDLHCRAEKISVEKVTDNNFVASGCGRKQTYLCSGSNFMTSGFCAKN